MDHMYTMRKSPTPGVELFGKGRAYPHPVLGEGGGGHTEGAIDMRGQPKHHGPSLPNNWKHKFPKISMAMDSLCLIWVA